MKNIYLFWLLLGAIIGPTAVYANEYSYLLLNRAIEYHDQNVIDQQLAYLKQKNTHFDDAKAVENLHLNNLFKTSIFYDNTDYIKKAASEGFNLNKGQYLHEAIRYNKFKVVKALVESGIYINQINEYGRSALDLAVDAGSEKITRYLISKGAIIGLPFVNRPRDIWLNSTPGTIASINSAPYPQEDITEKDQFSTGRIQFVWRAPYQSLPGLWSIKPNGKDLRVVLDERQLYFSIDKNDDLNQASRSPNNRYVLVQVGSDIRLYDLLTKHHIILAAIRGSLNQIIWNNDHTLSLYSGSNQYDIKLWAINLKELSYEETELEKDTIILKDSSQLEFSKNGTVDKINDDKKIYTITTNYSDLSKISINSPQTQLLISNDNKTQHYDLRTGELINTFSMGPMMFGDAETLLARSNKNLLHYINEQKKTTILSDKYYRSPSFLTAGSYIDKQYSLLPEPLNNAKIYYQKMPYVGELVNGLPEGYGEIYNRHMLLWREPAKDNRKEELPRYKGFWKAGLFSGKGVAVYGDLSFYDGNWLEGRRHGQGQFVDKDESGFDGAWLAGKKHGKGDCMTYGHREPCEYFDDGLILYEGERNQQGLRSGVGKASWYDKDQGDMLYVGQWFDDAKQGKGRLTINKDKIIYEGMFKSNLFHGRGDYQGEYDVHYIGDWKAGKRHGQGIEKNRDFSTYKGQWLHDKKEGVGVIHEHYVDGRKLSYDGHWQENYYHGQGALNDNGNVYTGEFKHGLLEGSGQLRSANGDHYKGRFKGSLRHGEGTQTYHNGDQYVGEWVNDLRSGKGKLTLANGDFYEGNWLSNKQHEQGVCHEGGITKQCHYFYGYKRHTETEQYQKITIELSVIDKDARRGTYIGQQKSTLPHGEGTFHSSGNHTYIGEFENGLFHGKGKLFSYRGGLLYDGQWSNGKPNGYGKSKHYAGSWKNGLAHGQGILDHTFEKFEGEWVDGKTSNGTITYKKDEYIGVTRHSANPGDIYKGSWYMASSVSVWSDGTNHFKHGNGILTHDDGSSETGIWHNDYLKEQ